MDGKWNTAVRQMSPDAAGHMEHVSGVLAERARAGFKGEQTGQLPRASTTREASTKPVKI